MLKWPTLRICSNFKIYSLTFLPICSLLAIILYRYWGYCKIKILKGRYLRIKLNCLLIKSPKINKLLREWGKLMIFHRKDLCWWKLCSINFIMIWSLLKTWNKKVECISHHLHKNKSKPDSSIKKPPPYSSISWMNLEKSPESPKTFLLYWVTHQVIY